MCIIDAAKISYQLQPAGLLLPDDIQERIMDMTTFDRYQLSPGQAIGDSFRQLITHKPNEEALITTHKFLKIRETEDKLKHALATCITTPSSASLEALLMQFSGTENALTHHHKYAQASVGLASMRQKGKRTNIVDKQRRNKESTAVMRNRNLARILFELTFTVFFDSDFKVTKLQGVLQGQADEFFSSVRALKLHEKYVNLAQKLAPQLEPLPVDVVLNAILQKDHPELYERLYIPSMASASCLEMHASSRATPAPSASVISLPIPEDSLSSKLSEDTEDSESESESVVIQTAKKICYAPEES